MNLDNWRFVVLTGEGSQEYLVGGFVKVDERKVTAIDYGVLIFEFVAAHGKLRHNVYHLN